jgi:uncharacterized membrane protein YkoI
MKNTVAACVLIGLLAHAPAGAQEWGHAFSPAEARDAVKEGRNLPLSRIFKDLKADFGGYQLGAELFSKEDGGSEYHIDWMTKDGRKMVFVVDAETGDIIDKSGA